MDNPLEAVERLAEDLRRLGEDRARRAIGTAYEAPASEYSEVRAADLIRSQAEVLERSHNRSLRLSASLIALVEHFERVDAGPEDKAAIKAACDVFAAVAAERGNDRSAVLTPEVKS